MLEKVKSGMPQKFISNGDIHNELHARAMIKKLNMVPTAIIYCDET